MRVLLDTCIVSELTRKAPNVHVVKIINELDEKNMFLSVLSVGEIIKGISLLDAGKRKEELLSWVAGLERSYSERLLSVDVETTRIWGETMAHLQHRGKTIPAVDGLIAATALRHGLHLITRNISDFEPTNVLLINPWNSPDSR